MDYSGFGAALRKAVGAAGHRGLVIIAGARSWGTQTAREVTGDDRSGQCLWIGEESPPHGFTCVPGNRVAEHLGSETSTLVFDAFVELDPNALGAAAGLVRGGGLFVLLTPPLDDWPSAGRETEASSPFRQRVTDMLRASSAVNILEQGIDPPPVPFNGPDHHDDWSHPFFRTRDQQQAVEAVINVVEGQRRKPLALVADRGRGKSAALGLAAGLLLKKGLDRIIVTGPHRRAVEPVIRMAKVTGGDCAGRLEFIAVDDLLQQRRETGLLLVDEAATIPAHRLANLLDAYPRIAFATTVHGYEGTGQGFVHRFAATLRESSRGYRECRLGTPIRWAAGDPVEAFFDDLLIMNAEPSPPPKEVAPDSLRLERVDQTLLAANEGLLRDLFGLLATAHYRTTPADLMQLLDDGNAEIFRLASQDSSVGVALITHEGELDSDTAQRVWSGQSRPRGHLLPQLLTQHLGLADGVAMACARVRRIAIHPDLQRQGIGRFLLDRLRQDALSDRDLVGASFGALPALIRFWRQAGFETVRIGLHQSRFSGAPPCLAVRGLSERGNRLTDQARAHFLDNFPYQLKGPLRDLDSRIVVEALRNSRPTDDGIRLPEADLEALTAFAFGARNADALAAALNRFVALIIARHLDSSSPAEQSQLMVERVLQSRSWADCEALAGQDGKDAGIRMLRGAVRGLLLAHWPEAVKAVKRNTGLDTDLSDRAT